MYLSRTSALLNMLISHYSFRSEKVNDQSRDPISDLDITGPAAQQSHRGCTPSAADWTETLAFDCFLQKRHLKILKAFYVSYNEERFISECAPRARSNCKQLQL